MKEKINRIKRTVEGMDQDHAEVVSALDQLDQEMAGESVFPGAQRVDEALFDTVTELEKREKVDEVVIAIWRKLVDEVRHWEMEHPRTTKIIGNIAQALANNGI